MTISKANYQKYLSRARNHYNLNVDDITVVSESAAMLATARYSCPHITIAVSKEKYTELKKFVLPDSGIKNHIKLLEGVMCRLVEEAELNSRRLIGNYWSLTKEFIKETLTRQAEKSNLTVIRRKEIQRELALLDYKTAEDGELTNRSKAMARINSTTLYLDIDNNDVCVIDQTINCLIDDVATDNSIILIGIETSVFAKIKKNRGIVTSKDVMSGTRTFRGFEIEPNTYVIVIPKKNHVDIMATEGIYWDKATGFSYLALKNYQA